MPMLPMDPMGCVCRTFTERQIWRDYIHVIAKDLKLSLVTSSTFISDTRNSYRGREGEKGIMGEEKREFSG